MLAPVSDYSRYLICKGESLVDSFSQQSRAGGVDTRSRSTASVSCATSLSWHSLPRLTLISPLEQTAHLHLFCPIGQNKCRWWIFVEHIKKDDVSSQDNDTR